MSRGSSQAAPLSGVKPRAMNGSQNRASSAATQKSEAIAMWNPRPAVQPRTTDTMGTCVSSINGMSRLALFGSRRCVLPTLGLRSERVLLAIRSDPAQKSGPSASIRMTRTDSSMPAAARWRDHRVEHHVVDRVPAVGTVERQVQDRALLFGAKAGHAVVAHGLSARRTVLTRR